MKLSATVRKIRPLIGVLVLLGAGKVMAKIDAEDPANRLYARPVAATDAKGKPETAADTNKATPSEKPAPAAVPKPAALPPFPELKTDEQGVLQVSFNHLASFDFPIASPDAPRKPGTVEFIRPEVRTLDCKQVCLEGFMLPIKMEGRLARDFLILRSQMMCCYGIMPLCTEWVIVHAKEGVPVAMDRPMKFYGTLRVGEIYDGGLFAGLYRMECDKVAKP